MYSLLVQPITLHNFLRNILLKYIQFLLYLPVLPVSLQTSPNLQVWAAVEIFSEFDVKNSLVCTISPLWTEICGAVTTFSFEGTSEKFIKKTSRFLEKLNLGCSCLKLSYYLHIYISFYFYISGAFVTEFAVFEAIRPCLCIIPFTNCCYCLSVSLFVCPHARLSTRVLSSVTDDALLRVSVRERVAITLNPKIVCLLNDLLPTAWKLTSYYRNFISPILL